MAIRYAQELVSLFILSVAAKAKPGSYADQFAALGPLPHEFIAQTIVENGLAQSREEAYTLVVPAFVKYQLLPTEEDEDDQDSVAEDELEVDSQPSVSDETIG